MAEHEHVPTAEDFAAHQETYKHFVKGVLLFAAHVLVILLILAWVFADRFGTAPLTGCEASSSVPPFDPSARGGDEGMG